MQSGQLQHRCPPPNCLTVISNFAVPLIKGGAVTEATLGQID